MKQLSVVMITFNEEQKVESALESIRDLADEIVVVDSESSDQTESICRRYAQTFISRRWPGYREQKQFATDLASHEWILSLDADEAISPELRREILDWKNTQDVTYAGYYLPRKAFFLGRWIEHTTWYPDWQLRIFRKSSGRWQGGRVHESFRVGGDTARFRGFLEHYTYSSVSEYLSQLQRFSSLAAEDYFERGKRAGWTDLTLKPAATFLSNYIVHLGFLDGVPGLAASAVSAISVFFKFLKLWERQSNTQVKPELE